MHPKVYAEFEKLAAEHSAGGAVLEVGAIPNDRSLLRLKALNGKSEKKIGINLDGPFTLADFTIVRGNANRMDFLDNSFDTVLCNATLEHDQKFWLSVSEMQRVLKPGGLIIIGVPGYKQYRAETWKDRFFKRLPHRYRSKLDILSTTATFRVHSAPGDFYRFSETAVRDVFLEGFNVLSVTSFLFPPRIIGAGRKPAA